MSPNLGSLENGVPRKRTAVKLKGASLALLSFQALGIIYSDIGTSPLYTLNGIWPTTGPVPSKDDVIGGISAIIWALTLLPLAKYVLISLRFGTGEGEGGTFALYQGLYPPEDPDVDADRTLTGDSETWRRKANPPKLSERLRFPLLAWCLFGTSLTIADGIFTPAVSVTSAVTGIGVAKPSINSDIIPISLAILVVLFMAQRFGTAKLSFLFAPIALIWFLILTAIGIYNISAYPGIFRAFDPSRAVLLFVRTKNYGLLSGVLLSLTGCEAMFANLGQFNARSIQISFTAFVYPSLILAYLGQGARLIVAGESVLPNIFYNTVPGPANGAFFWIVFVFAILATIIASQALISATFSLVQQIVNMKGLPPFRIVYTSETIQGQVYLPFVNWSLMISVIVIVAALRNLTNMTNAYGFAVATVMFSTTILLAVQMRYVKHWPIFVPVAYFLFFGFLDGLFWGAALKKVPEGAWIPLLIGIVLSLAMVFWTWAKGLEDAFDGANRKNLREFIVHDQSGGPGELVVQLGSDPDNDKINELPPEPKPRDDKLYYLSLSEDKSKEERHELVRIPSCAIFHKLSKGRGVPHTFMGFIRQWPALPRVVIFLSVSVLPIARVRLKDRYLVTKVRTIEGFYGVTYRIGFRDDYHVKINDLIIHLCSLEMNDDPKDTPEIVDELRRFALCTTNIVPHYHIKSRKVDYGIISPVVNWIRIFLIETVYLQIAGMFPDTGNWLTSADEIIRVGISATI